MGENNFYLDLNVYELVNRLVYGTLIVEIKEKLVGGGFSGKAKYGCERRM